MKSVKSVKSVKENFTDLSNASNFSNFSKDFTYRIATKIFSVLERQLQTAFGLGWIIIDQIREDIQ